MTDNQNSNEILTAYLDGELTADEARKLELRIDAEPQLADELSKLRAVKDAVRSLPREKLDAGFASGVLEQIERRHLISGDHSASRGNIHWSRYLTSAAMVLMVIGLGTLVFVTLYVPDQTDEVAIADKTQSKIIPPLQPAERAGEFATKRTQTTPETRHYLEADSQEVAGLEIAPTEIETAAAPPAVQADQAAPQEPHEPQTLESFLSDQQITAKDRPEAVIREAILTDNLPAAKANLQRILASFDIAPASAAQPADDQGTSEQPKSNIYSASPAGANGVQYVILLDQHHLPNLRRDIRSLGQDQLTAIAEQPAAKTNSIRHKRSFSKMRAGRSQESLANAPTTQPANKSTNGQLSEHEPMVALVVSLRMGIAASQPAAQVTTQPATQPATTQPVSADD